MKHLVLLLTLNLLAQSTAEERMKQGFEKFQRSGTLAQQGKFEEAQKLMSEATAEIDGAVASEPQNATLRMRRGSVYAQLPDFLNKKATAREDLEFAARDARYQERASAALARLSGAKKERFTAVPEGTSPVIAVASVTLPGHGVLKSRVDLPQLLAKLMKQMEAYEGFLGSHVVSIAEHDGMILVFTWWKSKQTLAAWVDGAAHQAVIREIYSQPASNATSSQVAMELFMPLPGSMQFGGGLSPKLPQEPRP
jgi:heme-degrading monooxygenase HmoA